MRLLPTAFALFLLACPARAQEGPIQATILAQIEAFEADDFARAFTFASPNIHALFGTPEAFGKMVREGYPMVWRPADVTMLDLRFIGGAYWQRVRVSDAKGRSFWLDYQMIERPEGWRINAVQMQEAPDVGA
ncbi:MAG: DUF4864 domain-containing protein [Pseudomonadota bacterium]